MSVIMEISNNVHYNRHYYILEKDLYLAIVLLNLYDYRLKMYTLLFYKFNLRKSKLQPFNK